MNEKLIDEILHQIKTELLKANDKFPLFNSEHEGYAILLEEVDEMWDEVKKNLTQRSIKECIQVGAMAVKYILSIRVKENNA